MSTAAVHPGASSLEGRAGRGRAIALALALCLVIGSAVWVVHVIGYRPMPAPGSERPAVTDGAPGIEGAGAGDPGRSIIGYPWRGAVHAHSVDSDGMGTIDEIVAAAAAAGLDFLVLTDHNPLSAQGGDQRSGEDNDRPAAAGWRDDVLLIVAEEISTLDGHALALGVEPHRYRFGLETRQAAADIEEMGGWLVAAHPAHPETPWTAGWALAEGVEIINTAEAWERAGTAAHVSTVLSYPLNADFAALRILADRSPAFERWDRLTRLADNPRPRPLVGIAAADAHGAVLDPLPLPGYREVLAVVNTVVWLESRPRPGDPAAGAAVLEALRAGRATGVIRSVGDPAGFFFAAWREDGDAGRELDAGRGTAPGAGTAAGATAAPGPARLPVGAPAAVLGEVVAFEEGPWTLAAGFPTTAPVRTVLLRDGEIVASADGEPLVYPVERPGTYRVEVYRLDGLRGAGVPGSTPWIAPNPIYIWPSAARRAARAYRVPPLPAPPVTFSAIGGGGWGAESATGASGSFTPRPDAIEWLFALPALGGGGPVGGAASGGAAGRGAANGGAAAGGESVAALAWRPAAAVDWSGTDGLVVELQAPRPLRLLVELRAVTPDGRELTWYRSVKVRPEGRAEGIPWGLWRRRPAELLEGPESERRAPGRREWLPPIGGGPTATELERVTGVFLIVTPGILAPGSSEAVTVNELGVY